MARGLRRADALSLAHAGTGALLRRDRSTSSCSGAGGLPRAAAPRHDVFVSLEDEAGVIRVGVFWRPDGLSPRIHGWPLNRLTFGPDGCSVRGRSFVWSELVGVDRTPRGVRFRFTDRAMTLVVGTPLGRSRDHLLRAVRAYVPSTMFEDWIHPLSSWRWDPDQ